VKDSVNRPVKSLKKPPIFIAGLPQVGKTTFICAMIRLAEKHGMKAAAIKPFDTGLLKRNAREQPGDGELIRKTMSGDPLESLIAPYLAQEDYPLELALRRDGVNVKRDKIYERLLLLDEKYDLTFIECPPSLYTPLNETESAYEWLSDYGKEIVFIIHPVQEQFTHNLAEIRLINNLDLQVNYLLNNASKIKDQDLVFYIWEKLESVTKQTMAGMIPYEREIDETFNNLAGIIEDNIPMTVEALFSRGSFNPR